MFNFVKAIRPAHKNTSSPSRMMGRRVKPNERIPFSTASLFLCSAPSCVWCYLLTRYAPSWSRGDGRRDIMGRRSAARLPNEHHVAQEHRTFGRHQLAGLQAIENLPVAIVLHADLDDALGELP